jgi:flavin-dependent dehydrogenase
VLESSKFPRYHIGESLIPRTYDTLRRIGLLEQMQQSPFPVKHSVRFVSPSGEESDPFYFSETVSGDRARTWQVERSRFDQMCLDNARQHGVDVRMCTKVHKVLFENGRSVGVEVRCTDDVSFWIPSRVVVDASGRATVIGNQLGLKEPVPGLNKASLWAYYRGGRRREGIDAGETTVFMIPQRGWFWYIPLPDDIVSVGIVADPDYLFGELEDFEHIFSREVARCLPLSDFLASAERTTDVRGLRRLSYRSRQLAGDGWLMIGDAAAFLDPIYSSGLFLALASAELAAECVHDALMADDLSVQRLGAFTQPLADGVEVIRRLVFAFYDPAFSFREFVERFPDQRASLIDCLIGDVIKKDMRPFLSAMEQMTAAGSYRADH